MIPNLLSSNLNYMSKIFNLKHQKAHRALDDTLASAELLLKYLNIFIHKDIHKVNNLYYPKNKFELDRINYKKETPINKIITLIESLTTPVLITLKGTEGVVLFSFPTLSTLAEKKYICQTIKDTPFELLTIKMIGPFFQGLIEMSSYFSKINDNLQKETVEKLCEFHNIPLEEVTGIAPIEFSHDFIIMNHLIPEQFIIYPLRSLHHKMELVFRYPPHQNKLVQYINSKSARIAQSKLKKDHLHPLIHNFLSIYLRKSKEYLLINRSNEKIITADLKNPFENFITQNPNNYNFPQRYL
jgi:DNA polymerase-3 subunit alpha (Gram-positive type)